MRTELLVPFQFDTEAVEKRIEAEAYDKIVNDIRHDAMNELKRSLPKSYGCTDWKSAVRNWLWEWFDEHADEVIDYAIILLAQKAKDKRRWRVVLDEIKKGEDIEVVS